MRNYVSDKKADMTLNEPDPDQNPQEAGQTETPESLTGLKTGRPNRDTLEPARWTIRGVETDTRLTIEKAAERSGKTLGQFFNTELREAAANVLKKGHQPPARAEDLGDLFEKIKSELRESQATELQSIREAIERRPASLREWLFGKRL
ncbi:hypothetical protein GCM10027185_62610 [Spirosoma pulveris]